MSYFFKNTRKLTFALSALFLVITITAGSFAIATQGLPEINADKAASGTERVFDVEPAFDAQPDLDVEAMSYTPVSKPVVHEGINGVILSPKTDFLKSAGASDEAIWAEIDEAVASVAKAGADTVIITTSHDGRVLYHTDDAPEALSSLELIPYIVGKCREENLYLYAVLDVSGYVGGDSSTDKLSKNLAQFCDKYAVDGILLDNYGTESEKASYVEYLSLGGSMGYDNYLNGASFAVVKTAVKAVRDASADMRIGLLADAKTPASYALIDFVALKADSTISKAVPLWAKNNLPVYAVFSSKGDELSKQMLDAAASGVSGNIFTSISNVGGIELTAAKESTKPVQAEVVATSIEKPADKPPVSDTAKAPAPSPAVELKVAKPEKTNYSTFEQTVTFSGSADPSKPLTINGRQAGVDKAGYFSVTNSLNEGQNTFVIKQGAKEVKYTVTRQLQLIKEISPTGVIMAEGDMSITITAVAYSEASLYAVINDTKVPMKVDTSAKLGNPESGFELFSGEYTAPEADGGEILILGGVSVYGSYNGQKEVMEGAHLAVSKTKIPDDAVPVAVTASQARTYSVKTKTNVPDPALYPLPKGALDYVVGDPVVYKKNSKETFTYAILASGVRIETKDIKKVTSGPSNNAITKLTVEEPGDGFTYIRLAMREKVTYRFLYKGSTVEILFNYTNSTPNSQNLTANELFSKAEFTDDNVLSLKLNKAGSFMGYKGYYENGDLVLRFNQIPSSIKTARIAIDAGHGGKDPGAKGFIANMPESVINRALAEKLEEELKKRGATVKLLEAASYDYQGPERALMAENFEADFLVSIHGNSSANTAATGTEVYYFNSYSRLLAQAASANVSKQLASTNRGAKPSYYHVTLSSQMPSVLIETGFLSNKAEYQKLVTDKYHSRIATGIADSLEAALKAIKTGSTSAPAITTVASEKEDEETTTVSDGTYADEELNDYGISAKEAEEPFISSEYLKIYKGNYARIEIMSESGDVVKNADFKWKSDKTSIASVDAYGVVRAKNIGETAITATYGDLELYCEIEVTNTKVDMQSITITKNAVTLLKGKTEQLNVRFTPSNVTDKSIVWKSSDNIIATVSASGVVKGINPGTATITARNKAGTVTAKCTVEVVRDGVNIEEIVMRYDRLEMGIGDKDDIPVVLYPANVTETKVTWTSTNPAVVKVDSKGNITALKKGTAIIKASSTTSKRIYAECEIEVFD